MQLKCDPKDYDTLCLWRDQGFGIFRLGLGDYVRAPRDEVTEEQLRIAIKIIPR